jgi:hypothetical protein
LQAEGRRFDPGTLHSRSKSARFAGMTTSIGSSLDSGDRGPRRKARDGDAWRQDLDADLNSGPSLSGGLGFAGLAPSVLDPIRRSLWNDTLHELYVVARNTALNIDEVLSILKDVDAAGVADDDIPSSSLLLPACLRDQVIATSRA